jgi:hypothetical protein
MTSGRTIATAFSKLDGPFQPKGWSFEGNALERLAPTTTTAPRSRASASA